MKTPFMTSFRTIGKFATTHLLLPTVFILIVFLFFPSRTRLQFDGDEGLNLMRGLLIDQGYALYEDIWSDQPPVYPHILASVFSILGYKVGVARFVSILFAGLIVWSVFQILRKSSGLMEGLVGVIILFFLPYFIRLSISVMVGLPAISLAAAALTFLILWQTENKLVWLILSAILLALSIQTKLFTMIMLPIFGIGIILPEWLKSKNERNPWKDILAPALKWGIAFVIPFGLIMLFVVRPEYFHLLYEGHLAASDPTVFQGQKYEFSYYLNTIKPILIIALLGSLRGVLTRNWLLLYPTFWLLFGYISLLFHRPIWYHHLLLMTVPAAILAADAIVAMGRGIIETGKGTRKPKQNRIFLVLSTVGILVLLFTLRPPGALVYLSPLPSLNTTGLDVGARKEKMIMTVMKYAPETTWIVTDMPMIAFRAKIPVPPEIAVFSGKRLETGAITEEMVIQIVKDYRPEQVLIGRFRFPNLEMSLAEAYTLVEFKQGDFSLYIQNDLLDQ